MRTEYKYDQFKYAHAVKCNGALCDKRGKCQLFYVKRDEAYEFIKAPSKCDRYTPLSSVGGNPQVTP